jgi:hypothetical protein
MLNQFIHQFAEEMDLPPIPSIGPGTYSLPLEPGLSITLTSMPQGEIFLSSTIAACPKSNQEYFYMQMLLGDLFGQGTRGAVLGINPEGTQLTLSLIVDYNIDYKGFKETIEDFINVIDYWRDEARSYTK